MTRMKSWLVGLCCVALCLVALVLVADVSPTAQAAVETGFVAGPDCTCCPDTCNGGQFLSCFVPEGAPKGAVTCQYLYSSGEIRSCLSCINDLSKRAGLIDEAQWHSSQ